MIKFFFYRFIYPLKELHYFFSYPIINFLIVPKKSAVPTHPKGTIVIVECWFLPNSYHALWQNYLEKKGYQTFLLTYTDMNESFEITAAKLNSQIKELKIENFTLVGISTGAIVCLEYLQIYKKWDTVKLFISVAGPLHGSIIAWLISFTRKGRDIVPGSHFLKKLSLQKIVSKKMVTLSALHDEFIPVKNSAWEGVPSHVIDVYGHNFFHLDHKKTYDLIAQLAK